jgi:CRP-like cAMP-binding protein
MKSSPVTEPLPNSLTSSGETGISSPALPPLGILSGLCDEALEDLAGYGRYHQVLAGTRLITEGAWQDRFYVVVSGVLTITARAGGKDVQLSTAEAGECLGEVNLLEPGPSASSVRVKQDATLWSMNVEDLRKYIAQHPGGGGALLLGMACCMSKRLRQANQLIRQHHVTPLETLPQGRERAITASNAPVQLGFFDRLKKSLTASKKVRISTEIKM